jgi:hypothetical protein
MGERGLQGNETEGHELVEALVALAAAFEAVP